MPDLTRITYRQAAPEDALAIARVDSTTKLACGLSEPALCGVERLQDRWDKYLRGLSFPQFAEEPRIAFVVEVDGEVVGFIAGHFSKRHGTEGELQSIHILPEYHGRGIGTELLRLLAEWFVSHGRQRICVGVDPNNPFQRFYVKHGAAYINEHWLVWEDIGGVIKNRNR